MLSSSFTYCWVLVGSLVGPFFCSFLPQVRFYRYWKASLMSSLCVCLLFIPWDAYFTHSGVWGFNPERVVGVCLFGLPLEEILFFVVIPFASLFVYECIPSFSFFPKWAYSYELSPRVLRWVSVLLYVAFWVVADKAYTASVVGGLSMLLFVVSLPPISRYVRWGQLILAYAIVLIPFFIVNGILTAIPVVWYDNTENLGIRMTTIPVEDALYQAILFLLNSMLFHWIRSRKANYFWL